MIIEVTNKLIINYRAHERINGKKSWCELPYPGHKNGCPNYGKSCPLPKVGDYFDLNHRHWFAIVRFDIMGHMLRMKTLHPDWSDRQCRCVLYWQNGVRKVLDKICREFINGRDSLTYHKIPEGMGVNVIRTMRKIYQPIQTKPDCTVTKVALIGAKKIGEEAHRD